MNEVDDEDIMRGVKVHETEWKQGEHSMIWYRRYAVLNMGEHQVLYNGKILGAEQWFGPCAEYWRHVADVVAHKQLRAFLDGRFNAIGPNVVLAREFDCLPLNSESLGGIIPLQ